MIGIPGLSIPRRRRRASFTGAYDAVPSIVAAYGMRRLRSAYTGSLLRMRRSSDNAESDFGYMAAGHLDTAAIVAWLSGIGYIVKWYDQSGNGYDATQSTAASQPLYVASGQNGRPVLRWDGTDDLLKASVSAAQPTTILTAHKMTSSHRYIYDSNNSDNRQVLVGRSVDYEVYAGNVMYFPGSSVVGPWYVISSMYDGASSIIYRNGIALGGSQNVGGQSLSGLTIGARFNNVTFLAGDIAELVICNAALSTADRQAAEAAANDYWGVY